MTLSYLLVVVVAALVTIISAALQSTSLESNIRIDVVIKDTHKQFAKLLGRSDISKIAHAPQDLNHVVLIALKSNNMHEMETMLMDVSDPNSANYGAHLSVDEVSSLAENPDSISYVREYLNVHGIQIVKTSRNNLLITAEAPISKWEEVFGNEFYLFKQTDLADVHLVRAEEYSLPDVLVPHVESVLNVIEFPSTNTIKKHGRHSSFVVQSTLPNNVVNPTLLNDVYSIRTNEGHVNATQAVVGVLDDTLSTADLARFQKWFNLPLDTVNNIGGHVTTECSVGDDCTMPNLSVQYLMATSQDSPTTFMYWSGTDFWLDWITAVAEMRDPPKVMTITHTQYEHEIAQSIANLFNIEAMKLSLAGTTIVVAAGDDGAAGPDARSDPLRCGYFPVFPATSPYVISVGATMGLESGGSEVACQSDNGGESTSGGGFSTLFTAPEYQSSATSEYCSQFCSSAPTVAPTWSPSQSPSEAPSVCPSQAPSASPSRTPSANPSREPSVSPSATPSRVPTLAPTTFSPSSSKAPTTKPSTRAPSIVPSRSMNPTYGPLSYMVNWYESPTVMNKSPAAATRVMSADGSTVFVTTTEVVYVSRDYGYSYSVVDVDGTRDFIGLACSATCEYCFIVEVVGRSAKRSSDFGVTWEVIDLSAITKQTNDGPSRAVASQDGQNVILLGKFLVSSSDYGITFSKLNTPSSFDDYPNTEFEPGKVFISMDRSDRLYLSYFKTRIWPWSDVGVLFKSNNFGATWVEMSTPETSWRYPHMSFDLSGFNGVSTVIKSGGATTTIYTRDKGVTWTEAGFGSADAIGLSMCQDHETGQFVTVGGSSMNEVYSSKNYGQTFQLNPPTTATAAQKHRSIACSYDGRFVVTGADDASYYGIRVILTAKPTPAPSVKPSSATPTLVPTTIKPSKKPTSVPSTALPSISAAPTITFSPSARPTTIIPTFLPTVPSCRPTTRYPSASPSRSFTPSSVNTPTGAPTNYTTGYLRWKIADSPGNVALGTSSLLVMSADGSTIFQYSSNAGTNLKISRDFGSTYTTHDISSWDTGFKTGGPNIGLSCSATCEFCYAMHYMGLKASRSHDFGITWQSASLETITKQAVVTAPCISVTSQDGSTVIFLSRFMAISTDYGVTVNKLLPPPSLDPDTEYRSFNTGNFVTYISMDRSDRLYFSHMISGVGLLFKSLDFGATWVEMNTPATDYLFTTVSFDVSGTYGVAAVAFDHIPSPYATAYTFRTIFSHNGGASWNTSLSSVGRSVCQDHATGKYVNSIGTSSDDLSLRMVQSSVDFGATFTPNNPDRTDYGSINPFIAAIACSYDGSYVVIDTFDIDKLWTGTREISTRRLTGQGETQQPLHARTTSDNHNKMKSQSTCVTKQNQYSCVGRGYPDLAVLGYNYFTIYNNQTHAVSSTSASASVVAGMISLVNARRLKAGKSTLGWLNPALYANHALFANDITSGENNCAAGGEVCCGAGYTAGTGWDPVTGLGSVNFTAFSDVMVALGNSAFVPTRKPTPGPGQPTLSPVTPAPSFPPYTAPEKDDGWFAVKYYEGDQCVGTLLEATATVTNTCVKEYNSMGVATGSKRFACEDSNTALLTRYSDVSCATFVSSETYYLGCNPEVRVTDANGHAQPMSVSLFCSEVVTPYLDIVPGNGLNYAAQVSYATGDSCSSDVHGVAIHVEGRCLTVTGTNTSVIYNFPQRDTYSGTQCETWADQQTLSTVCSAAESKWLGYSPPTFLPTIRPTRIPTTVPTIRPTRQPTYKPTFKPSFKPTPDPSGPPIHEH